MKAALLLSSLLPLSLLLGQETWNVDNAGNWGLSTNWTPAVVPNAQNATATFGNAISAARIITLDINPTVGSLIFSNSGQTYHIAGSGVNTFTMSVSAGSALINMQAATTALQDITAPMVLTSNLSITQGSNSNLTLGGVISGGSSVTLSGAGTGLVILSAGNTFSGGLTITTGTIQCAASTVLPATGTVALNGGLLDLNGTAQTIGGLSGTSNIQLGVGTLTVSTSGANSYGGQILGGGSLVVSGTGSLTLTVASSYNGGTTVSGGSLILGLDNTLNIAGAMTVSTPGVLNLNNFSQTVKSLAGSGSVTLGSGTLTIGGNASTVFSGAISGTGSFVQNGTATTTLSGTSNSYTGGTTIASGTLQLGVSGALPPGGPVTMSGGVLDLNNFSQTVGTFSATAGSVTLGSGQLTVAPTASANFAAVISLGGSVVFQGPFAWVYQAVQTYTGGTTINGGTLQMGIANAMSSTAPVVINSPGILSLNNFPLAIGSLAGSGAVSLGSGNLTLNTSGTTTFSGSITDTGQLIVNGTGTQILSGTNFYSGGTTVGGTATLEGTTSSLQGAIVNNSILFFNQSFAGQFGGPLSGVGTLKIGGGGVVTLTGTPTQNSVTVSGAQLNIASGANLTAPTVSIGSTGILSGAGTITGSVLDSGTIHPSSQLTVTGNVTFQPGSFFVADLTPTTSDRLIVGGTVTIQNGSQVIIDVQRGEYEVETRYAIITSGAGPVIGQFQGFELTNPFLSAELIYNQLLPGSVEVDLMIRSIGDVIKGGNAGAIAQCLTQANMRKDHDLEQLISQVIFFSIDEVREILEEMQPSQLRTLTVAEQEGTLFAQQMISWRMAEFDRTECEKKAMQAHPWNLWLSLAGNWTDQRPAEHNVAYEAPAMGLTAGFDGKIADNLFLGFALEYGHTALSWRESQGSSAIDRISSGPYLSWVGRFGYINLSLLGSFANFDTTRNIPFFNRTATSHHHGETLLTHLDGGIVFHPAPGVSLTPFAVADLIFGWEAAYQEAGAGSLNFLIASSSSTLLRTELGLKIAKCAVRSHGKWVHDIKASWVREERFDGGELHATFRQFPCSFTVQGLYPSRSLLDLGMGLTFLFKKDKFAASLRYEGQFGESVTLQSGIGQLLVRF